MVLITGCNSLLGKVISKRLMDSGVQVRGFDFWKVKDSPVTTEFFEGSILDDELVLGLCEGVDVIYHLLEVENSSHYGRRFMKRVNVKGTESILKAAKESEVKKVIYLSSSKVYGRPQDHPISEEDAVKPNTAYGRDKLKAERLCRRFAEEEEMDVTVFRPTTMTGPGIDDPMILIILYMALAMDDSNRLYVAGDGNSRYQLVHPDDVAEALLSASGNPVSRGKVYNLGSDNVPTQMEQVTRVKELAGLDCRIKHISAIYARVLSFVLRPLNINYLRKEHLVFILSNFLLDCSRAKADLGWKPKKDNVEIFAETLQWYRDVKL